MDLGRMEAGMRSAFLCYTTRQSWVRGVRPRSSPGDCRQPVLGVGSLAGSQLPSGPAPGYSAGLPGLSRAFPGWGQPGALDSCPRMTTVSHSPCFMMGEAGLTAGLTSPGAAGRAAGSTASSLGTSRVAGMPVARGGQTVSSQAPLCFDPGSPASDRTEGKKKGRPKAENQALRDIPVSSPKAGVGPALESASLSFAMHPGCHAPKPSLPAAEGRSTL